MTGWNSAFARPLFSLPTDFPDTYSTMHRALYGWDLEAGTDAPREENIADYLEDALCGGRAPDGESVAPRIATVEGLPGHDAAWD